MPDALFWALVANHAERITDAVRQSYLLPIPHPTEYTKRPKSWPLPRRRIAAAQIPENISREIEYLGVRRPSLALLLCEVASRHGLTTNDIRSRSRNHRVCFARHDFCYRAAKETIHSYPTIGRFLERDHTTVLHSVQLWSSLFNLPCPRNTNGGRPPIEVGVHARRIPPQYEMMAHG